MDPDTPNHWRRTIKKILAELAAVPFPDVVNMSAKAVFDQTADVCLVVVEGWQDVRRLHGCMAHIEIKGDRIWIQQDGTEDGIATDLLAAGVPTDRIVLGIKPPLYRQHTDFAVA